MPRITIRIGGPEPLRATINKASPMGLLGTDAIVHVGQLIITGQAAALRVLADACEQAAAMAEEYDADPDAWNQREQAEREADR
jgi:malonyl CoA-acyl carrier protein transacylase